MHCIILYRNLIPFDYFISIIYIYLLFRLIIIILLWKLFPLLNYYNSFLSNYLIISVFSQTGRYGSTDTLQSSLKSSSAATLIMAKKKMYEWCLIFCVWSLHCVCSLNFAVCSVFAMWLQFEVCWKFVVCLKFAVCVCSVFAVSVNSTISLIEPPVGSVYSQLLHDLYNC